MRGKENGDKVFSLSTRITPACAGKSKSLTKKEELKKDHPRVCGEKRLIITLDNLAVGSPPRVRGKEARR